MANATGHLDWAQGAPEGRTTAVLAVPAKGVSGGERHLNPGKIALPEAGGRLQSVKGPDRTKGQRGNLLSA